MGSDTKNTAAKNFTPPPWIDPDAWAGYLDMRKLIRRPPTTRALQLCVKTLEKLRAAGNDPNAVLDQSTQRSWQGLFALPREAQQSQDDMSMQAFNEVRRCSGVRPDEGWSHPKTGPALHAIGGQPRIADMRTTEIGFLQKEFAAQFRIAVPDKPRNVVSINQHRKVSNG